MDRYIVFVVIMSNKWVSKCPFIAKYYSKYDLIHLFHIFFHFFSSRQLTNLNGKWQQPMDSHGPGWKMGPNFMRPVARWTDGMFLRTSLLSSSSHSVPRKPQGSSVVTQHERIVSSAFGQVDLSILIVKSSILLVWLAIGPAAGAMGPVLLQYWRDSDTGWRDSHVTRSLLVVH